MLRRQLQPFGLSSSSPAPRRKLNENGFSPRRAEQQGPPSLLFSILWPRTVEDPGPQKRQKRRRRADLEENTVARRLLTKILLSVLSCLVGKS